MAVGMVLFWTYCTSGGFSGLLLNRPGVANPRLTSCSGSVVCGCSEKKGTNQEVVSLTVRDKQVQALSQYKQEPSRVCPTVLRLMKTVLCVCGCD